MDESFFKKGSLLYSVFSDLIIIYEVCGFRCDKWSIVLNKKEKRSCQKDAASCKISNKKRRPFFNHSPSSESASHSFLLSATRASQFRFPHGESNIYPVSACPHPSRVGQHGIAGLTAWSPWSLSAFIVARTTKVKINRSRLREEFNKVGRDFPTTKKLFSFCIYRS